MNGKRYTLERVAILISSRVHCKRNKQTNVTRDKEHSNNKIADSSKNNNFKHIRI